MKKHDDIKNIINTWLREILSPYHKKRLACSFEVYGRNIYIYTNKPGILIGYKGSGVYTLQDRLKQNGVCKNVSFVEIGDGYANEVAVKRKWF